MPYRPMDYHPDEPHAVIWAHLTDNQYSKKAYSRKKYVAQRRKQLAEKNAHKKLAEEIDGVQMAEIVREAQRKLKGLQNPET